jgi:hypothetical protein
MFWGKEKKERKQQAKIVQIFFHLGKSYCGHRRIDIITFGGAHGGRTRMEECG